MLESTLFRLFRFPAEPLNDLDSIWALMQQDKKNASGKVRLALPDARPYAMKLMEISCSDVERGFRYFNSLNDSLAT